MRLVTAAALVMLAAPTMAQQCRPGVVPDQSAGCTPGAVATTDRAEIVSVVDGKTYTKRHRVWIGQRDTMAKYGIPWPQHKLYEDDDLLPVCGGANNADPHNHWPQPSDKIAEGGWGYETKDILDAGACRLLKQGKIDVAKLDGWFLAPDWRPGYCEYREIAHEPRDPKCDTLK